MFAEETKQSPQEHLGAFPGSSDGEKSICKAIDLHQFLDLEDPLEREMATHSSILGWTILCTEEPGRLQSMGLQRVGLD